MSSCYSELAAVCGRLLHEEKNATNRALLSKVVKELKDAQQSTTSSSPLKTRNLKDDSHGAVLSTAFELNFSSLSLLGFACRMVLLGNSGTRYSSKGLIASLEFATILLNSGLIPIMFSSDPPEINLPKASSGGASDFFSKLLGGSSTDRNIVQPTLEKKAISDGNSSYEKFHVFQGVVEGVLSVAHYIKGKEANDKLLFTLVTALQASAVPRCSRVSLLESNDNVFHFNSLCVRGDVLIQVVESLFGIISRSNAILPLMEEAKSALNQIAKALSKAVEDESSENESGRNDTVETKCFQFDASKILEYCCSLTEPAVTPSTGSNNNVSGVLSLSNEHSMTLLTALGFILHLTVNAGPVFRNSTTILSALKSAVIPATIRTALLKELDAFRLSLNILLTCSITFGPQMVNETETIFRHVFFRVLESRTTSLTQKSLIVEAFRRYIEEPQNLLALFLNYDCNTHSQSVYEQMICYLSTLALVPNLKTLETSDHDEGTVRKIMLDFPIPEPLQRNALTTLLLVAYSNVQWIERFEYDQNNSFARRNLIADVALDTSMTAEIPNDASEISLTDSSEKGNELFIQALRVKNSFKKFIYLMNETKDATAAIDFLLKEPLLLPEIQEIKSPSRTNTTKDKCEDSGFGACTQNKDSHVDNTNNVGTDEKELVHSALQIALFLKEKEDYVDKLVLGEYFAKSFRKPMSRLVFMKWIEQHSFVGLLLDEALRLFLGGFKLLGEAEVVDKTMELFAAQYCKEHPTAFRSANTAFILSFSICMLNTDAHSPHVKDKMTLEGFIRNNKGIDEGNDVDPNLLKGIYERITMNEIKLRPSTKLNSFSTGVQSNAKSAKKLSAHKLSSELIETIPILRHFAPVARAITDTVMIPLDIAGGVLFSAGQRKEQELYQAELRVALKDMMEALNTTNALSSSFVEATTIENAIPMWSITVDYLVKNLLLAFEIFFQRVESASFPPNVQYTEDPSLFFFETAPNREYFDILIRGVVNTVRVCCDFGNVSQVELLVEGLFQLTRLQDAMSVSTNASSNVVVVSSSISKPRIELLAVIFNLFLSNGASFTTRTWSVAYTGVSLLDLLANGIEGVWKRPRKVVSSGDCTQNILPDAWFGNLDDIPISLDKSSKNFRIKILSQLRKLSFVDAWLERLFDVTEYPSQARVFMVKSLVFVCEKELQCSRTFSLTKLFDFVTVCASFSSRMQWRDLWTNASKVFTLAGSMPFEISNAALDGLRIIALSYLTREELLNYSFQKKVLLPFKAILMGNQDVRIRQKVIQTLAELIDFRASELASGWNVVFSILSHSAVIPEVVKCAWDVCENIITSHVSLMKDCFMDLIFCLTSFACNNVDENIALLSTSYLRACAHWLQFGLEAPPADVRNSTSVSEWAGRFKDADSEARASEQIAQGLARVSQSLTPITSKHNLEKPVAISMKTDYHLWMPLFEGMIPIILVHPSVRVRAHVVCSLWALIGHYGVAFAKDIQESLFRGILRPVISSLVMHAPDNNEGSFDILDYKLLAFLSLRSMFIACRKHPHLLFLACETFTAICMNPASLHLFQTGFVDVLLRICVDLGPSFIYGLVSEDVTRSLWVGRLLHEMHQIGFIDVVNFKRTAGWTELHHAAAVPAQIVDLDPTFEEQMHPALHEKILSAIAEGILPQILSVSAQCTLQEDLLICSRATRKTFLVVALYCSQSDFAEKAFPVLRSGFSPCDYNVPEQLLLVPYLCVLVEFVYVLRSTRPSSGELVLIHEISDLMSSAMKRSRAFCMKHQTEFVAAAESQKMEKDPSSTVLKKHKGRCFIDIFRAGREPLTSRARQIARGIPPDLHERIQQEWVYLAHVLGFKYAFDSDGVLVQCIKWETLRDIVLIFPSEIEEELIGPFLNSCWDELDLGIPLKPHSILSQALILFAGK